MKTRCATGLPVSVPAEPEAGHGEVSLRLQLLQVARLSPRLLRDSTDLVRDFFRGQLSSDGAGFDRDGRPDLYYTIFALAGLQATGCGGGPAKRWKPFFDRMARALPLISFTCQLSHGVVGPS